MEQDGNGGFILFIVVVTIYLLANAFYAKPLPPSNPTTRKVQSSSDDSDEDS